MRLKMIVIFVAVVMMASSTLLTRAEARQRKPPSKTDAISGNWDAAFEMEGGAASFTLTLKLKLSGDKVTGEFEFDQIGTGKVSNGSWAANKLTLTIETNHGAMLLTGKFEKGKLTGQFNAGQMQGKWEANKNKNA